MDLILKDGDRLITSLSHPSEKPLHDRQVRVDGHQAITSVRTESTLDKIAAALLRGFMRDQCDAKGDDEILTRFGFRVLAVADNKLKFIERLVALQLIIRRCLELHETAGGDPLPTFGFDTPDAYNCADWNRLLSDSETPGTASPQKKTAAQQIAEVEATVVAAGAGGGGSGSRRH